MKILLLADIHGNYPALQAITSHFPMHRFDLVVNCGDSLVYAPFSNETMAWLECHQAISILGNTDKKVCKLLKGKSFKKPSKPEKRMMYTLAAEQLTSPGKEQLLAFPQKREQKLPLPGGKQLRLGIFHGSPADHDEFIFADTPASRFTELTHLTDCDIIVSGHSHSPYWHQVRGRHFINPGSVGRMFDGDPRASCATLTIEDGKTWVNHHRLAYDLQALVDELRNLSIPPLYEKMYLTGRKLN